MNVTVYVITKDRVELLMRAVNSVLAQTVKCKLIIVDDGSADNTGTYLEKLSKKFDNVKYFSNKKSMGACFCRNLAIFDCDTKYITGLDDDDYFDSDRVKIFLQNKFILDEGYSCIYSDVIFNKNNRNIIDIKSNTVSDKELIFKGNNIGNQVFTKTERLKHVGGFDVNLLAWQDYEMWYRLTKKFGTAKKVISHPLMIIDLDHEYSRITMSKISKIESSYDLFIEKHELSIRERIYLGLNIYNYKGSFFSIKHLIFCYRNYIFYKSTKCFIYNRLCL